MRKIIPFLLVLFSCQNNIPTTEDSSTPDVVSYDVQQEESSVSFETSTDVVSEEVAPQPTCEQFNSCCIYPNQLVAPCGCHILSVNGGDNLNNLCCSGRALTYLSLDKPL